MRDSKSCYIKFLEVKARIGNKSYVKKEKKRVGVGVRTADISRKSTLYLESILSLQPSKVTLKKIKRDIVRVRS